MSAFATGLTYDPFGLPLIVDLAVGLAVGPGSARWPVSSSREPA